ncbi:MAG: hypothetical protein AB7O32_04920 [Vicinamibacterales bacterium]
MSAFRSNSRGTLVLKRKFRGLARIRRASGTQDPRVLAAMEAMLVTLYDQGRVDLLEALARNELHPMVLYDRFRTQRLDRLPRAELLPPLLDRFGVWIDEADVAEETRRGRRGTLAILKRYAAASAALTELPGIVAEYRAAARQHPRAFNLTRATCLAFVRDLLGRRHPLYEGVADVQTLKVRRTNPHRPMTPTQLKAAVKALGDPYGMMAWTMATTGMGPKEYFLDGFEVFDDRIVVHGQKRAGRERLVPRVSIVMTPGVGRVQWQRKWRQHVPGHAPYDLRRTFANLMVQAGIEANRRRAYMGHGARTITELYEEPQVEAYLAQDATALRAVLGEPEPTRGLLRLA